jgi:hypothetical protein
VGARLAALKAILDQQEQTCAATSLAQIQPIRARYKLRADRIKAELAGLKATVEMQVRTVDARLSRVTPELSKLNYERGRLKRELDNSKRLVSFPTYLKRIIFLAR